MKLFTSALIIMLSLPLVGCSDNDYAAPVMDISYLQEMPRTGVHRVRPNETLYSIAFRYGLDYRYLAASNHIAPPYKIYVGQAIHLCGPDHAQPATMITRERPKPQPVHFAQTEPGEPHYSSKGWCWPTRGKIIRYYSAANKGVNIAGKRGQAIHAAAGGKVVYCGNGLRGYGNLIIIKHNNLMLSAYAHNARVLVREGSWVNKGQKIAEMGDTGADKVMLHFEIRRAGKPVNPLMRWPNKQ